MTIILQDGVGVGVLLSSKSNFFTSICSYVQ